MSSTSKKFVSRNRKIKAPKAAKSTYQTNTAKSLQRDNLIKKPKDSKA